MYKNIFKKKSLFLILVFLLNGFLILNNENLSSLNSNSAIFDNEKSKVESPLTDKIHASIFQIKWAGNGTIVSTTTNGKNDPIVASDMAGGVIISWTENTEIYAQRLNSAGVPQWGEQGIIVCDEASQQRFPSMISDGAGGAIIAWDDFRSGSHYDIYAQKINSNGVSQWQEDGVVVCNESLQQTSPKIVTDGTAGAIVVWNDGRLDVGQDDIYAQRIDASGSPLWMPNGTALCNASYTQDSFDCISDGLGGVIVTWRDDRDNTGNYDIYIQRINSTGDVKWADNGTAICTADETQKTPTICSDGSGGAIIAWNDERFSIPNSDIYAQRINSTGAIKWADNGTIVCNADSSQLIPKIISSDTGGAIVVWADSRNTETDIYAQKINSEGTTVWIPNGSVICNSENYQDEPRLVTDGARGAIVTWIDLRNTNDNDIYAQRVNTEGTTLWTANGSAIGNFDYDQSYQSIISSDVGGAFIAWQDSRDGGVWNIYAQKIVDPPSWSFTNTIEINGSATGVGAHNWTWAESQPWCQQGDGTRENPYIIENVKINITTSEACLTISDSSAYFRIRNCTFQHDSYYGTGLVLDKVGNATITNTTCDLCYKGIELTSNCRNNTIENSVVKETSVGINCREYCSNNSIVNNDIQVTDYGIDMESGAEDCDDNRIINNTIVATNPSSNSFFGIGFYDAKNILVKNNSIIIASTDVELYAPTGIRLTKCLNAKLEQNTLVKCGILMESFSLDVKYFNSHSIDSTNKVNGKPIYYYANKTNLGRSNFTNAGQVILANCSYSNASNLFVLRCSRGISVFSGHNNTIANNNCSYNSVGIEVIASDNCTIAKNNCSNCQYGMNLKNFARSNVIENEIAHNEDGIYFDSLFNNNNISKNHAYKNNLGFYMTGCSHNEISWNNVSYNYGEGIYIRDSNDDNITNNVANHNNLNGIYFYSCYNEIVSKNTASYNAFEGIVMAGTSHNNIVSRNTANQNGRNGIVASGSTDCQIVANHADYNGISGFYGEAGGNTNNVSGNSFNHNAYGIYLLSCMSNNLTQNTATYNTKYGVKLESSNDTRVIGNYMPYNMLGCIEPINCDNTNVYQSNTCTINPPQPPGGDEDDDTGDDDEAGENAVEDATGLIALIVVLAIIAGVVVVIGVLYWKKTDEVKAFGRKAKNTIFEKGKLAGEKMKEFGSKISDKAKDLREKRAASAATPTAAPAAAPVIMKEKPKEEIHPKEVEKPKIMEKPKEKVESKPEPIKDEAKKIVAEKPEIREKIEKTSEPIKEETKNIEAEKTEIKEKVEQKPSEPANKQSPKKSPKQSPKKSPKQSPKKSPKQSPKKPKG